MSDYNPKHDAPKTHPLLTNGTYDALKKVVTLVLPALGAFYFALAGIWGLPAAEQVIGTIAALTTFLGVILNVSGRTYNNSDEKYDGQLNVVETEGSKVMQLELNAGPEVLEQQREVSFRVVKQ